MPWFIGVQLFNNSGYASFHRVIYTQPFTWQTLCKRLFAAHKFTVKAALWCCAECALGCASPPAAGLADTHGGRRLRCRQMVGPHQTRRVTESKWTPIPKRTQAFHLLRYSSCRQKEKKGVPKKKKFLWKQNPDERHAANALIIWLFIWLLALLKWR